MDELDTRVSDTDEIMDRRRPNGNVSTGGSRAGKLVRWLAFAGAVLQLAGGVRCDLAGQDDDYTLAYVNLTFTDPAGKKSYSEKEEVGKYGHGKIDVANGLVVHVRNKNGTSNYGCEQTFDNEIPHQAWIALIRRGQCSYTRKIANAAMNNATAVVIYDDRTGPTQKMPHRVPNFVSIFIPKEKGERIAEMVENGTCVHMYITVGTHQSVRYTNINRTSVLFVSISFIVLMIISLAWLIFYYVQRFRYINAKDQLARRLCGAAKKALAKIPVKTIKETDYESECCAVCIEPYKVSDVLRILPCKHQFHKSCVDPWLLDHRTCPMCKMDILKFYGLVFTGSQESILQIEIDDGMLHGHGDPHEPAGGRGNLLGVSGQHQQQHGHQPAPGTHATIRQSSSSRSVCTGTNNNNNINGTTATGTNNTAANPAMSSGSSSSSALRRSTRDVSSTPGSATFQTNSIDSIKIAILENSPMASARMLLNRHSAYKVSLPPEQSAALPAPVVSVSLATAAAAASSSNQKTEATSGGESASEASKEDTTHADYQESSARETKNPQEEIASSSSNSQDQSALPQPTSTVVATFSPEST